MTINKLLTIVNYEKADNRDIDYIVIHYVGATGGAEANCRYFEKFYRGVSAHYFVGHKGEIWQCVLDGDIAWHCGANKYKHPHARNSNSIGIEMCCRQDGNGNWYFEDETVKATIDLVKYLKAKHNIPTENIIRHYDVSGKICPAPFVKNNTKHTWEDFLQNFKATTNNSSPQKKKSNEEIAKEVLNGKWGNGADRKQRLAAAGYDAAAIQSLVNALLAGSKATTKPLSAIAKEVIAGKWGNGQDRKNRLTAAGYDYEAVQAEVNRLLK